MRVVSLTVIIPSLFANIVFAFAELLMDGLRRVFVKGLRYRTTGVENPSTTFLSALFIVSWCRRNISLRTPSRKTRSPPAPLSDKFLAPRHNIFCRRKRGRSLLGRVLFR